MSTLITDDNGMPIPQYYDATNNIFQKMLGQGGSINVSDTSRPSTGIYNVKLLSKDEKEVAVSDVGVPVILVDASVNNMLFTGTKWVAANQSCNLPILANNAYTAAYTTSSRVYNNGCKNALLCFIVGTTTNSISGIRINLIRSDGVVVPYKTINFASPVSTGSTIVSLGINDDTNKLIIPSDFTIDFLHTDSSTAITYQVDLQLV